MKSITPAPLFLSYVKSHGSLDQGHFKEGSVRSVQGACTLAAIVKGLHNVDVLKMADWSR